jgi:LPS sulfotransferase NodH
MRTTFQALMTGVEPNAQRHAWRREAAGRVTHNYLILFNGRAGSSWLTALLAEKLGRPGEYLNPDFLPDVARNVGAVDREGLLTGLQGDTATNGVFGVEATSEHLRDFGIGAFFAHFRDLAVFHLWRDNLVAQAISVFRAVQTRYFHSTDGGAAPPLPAYDGAEIAHWFRHMGAVETLNFRLLDRLGLHAEPLVYETMVVDPAGTLASFYRVLGLPMPPDTAPAVLPSKVTPGAWATEMEERFRAEHAQLVRKVQANRLSPRLTAG